MSEIELKLKIPTNENPLESLLAIQSQLALFTTEMALFYKDDATQEMIWADFAKTYSWLGLLILEPFPNELFKMHDFRDSSIKKLLKETENWYEKIKETMGQTKG